jgi:iron only hydrogenase large subunit-like protein
MKQTLNKIINEILDSKLKKNRIQPKGGINYDGSYNEDQKKVVDLLRSKNKTILMVAPSFVVDFDYLHFVPTMKGLGFDSVSELTFGAKVVNEQYLKYISTHKKKSNKNNKKFITSVCPTIVALVKSQAPELKKCLLPFDSPMIATAKILHKENPKNKIVFLSPCSAKKLEAKKPGLISGVVTFSEMKQIIKNENPKKIGKTHLFDRFYNDYTKIYPLSGGLAETMHSKGILKKEKIVSCDNCKNVQIIFDRHSEKEFFDLLFCSGGCVGGNGVESKMPILLRKKRVLDYRAFARKEKIGERRGLKKYTKGLSFKTNFD